MRCLLAIGPDSLSLSVSVRCGDGLLVPRIHSSRSWLSASTAAAAPRSKPSIMTTTLYNMSSIFYIPAQPRRSTTLPTTIAQLSSHSRSQHRPASKSS